MKRAIAFLLTAVMMLGLCACGEKVSPEEAAFNAACEKLTAGDYEGAIADLEAIPLYQSINEKIEEARTMKLQNSGVDVVGKWTDIHGWNELEFLEDGTYITGDVRGKYGPAEGGIEISEPYSVFMSVEEENGVQVIILGEQKYYREEDMGKITEVVELTMENLEEYFDLIPAIRQYFNSFGEVEYMNGIVLCQIKPEYKDKVVEHQNNLDNVGVEIQYDVEYRTLDDSDPTNWIVGDVAQMPYWWDKEEGKTEVGQLYDRRTYETDEKFLSLETGEELDNTSVCCEIYAGGWISIDNVSYFSVPVNYQVTRVTGSMMMYK